MKIILYTEDIPVKEGIVSTGLARVNSYFIKKFDEKNIYSFFFNKTIKGFFSKYNEIDEAVFFKTNMSEHGIAFKLLSFFILVIFKALKIDLQTYFSLVVKKAGVQNKLLRLVKDVVVFAPIGVDYTAIQRAAYYADTIKAKLIIYLVDDPVAHLTLTQVEKKSIVGNTIEFKECLKLADRVLCISDGLSEKINNLYGISCSTMNLPYINKITNTVSDVNFNDIFNGPYIVFVGNASHFYQDGIDDLVKVLRDKYGASIKLVLTISNEYSEQLITSNSDIVRLHPCTSESALKCLIEQALCSFLPYAFGKEYKDMVTTSFPSKLLDYLYWSKRILAYAPDYSVTASLMRTHNFKFLLQSRDASALSSIINDILYCDSADDMSSQYLCYLKRMHIDFDYCNYIENCLSDIK